MFVPGYHWLPLATIDIVGDNREFEVLRHILSSYTHCGVVDNLETSKGYQCLSLFTIGYP